MSQVPSPRNELIRKAACKAETGIVAAVSTFLEKIFIILRLMPNEKHVRRPMIGIEREYRTSKVSHQSGR